MTDQEEPIEDAPATGISEAERMEKIRDLLMGPVIANESARVDGAVSRLNELLKEQQELITALQARVGQLEDRQREGTRKLRLRLFGLAEALLADEEEVRARVHANASLAPKLEDDEGRRGA